MRNGQEETAKTLLLQITGNKTDIEAIQEAWRDAVKDQQADIQRAILLLGYADQDRSFRLLQEDAVTDPGVAAVMKEIPYFSPKRGWPSSFNCEAMFPGTNKAIGCLYLTEHRQEKLEQSARLKFDDVQYASLQNIAANVSSASAINAKFNHVKAHAAETHLFHNHGFGKVLVGQFGEMQRKKETTRLLLLATYNHAMSMELKVKDRDGKPHYVAALFDPNFTTSHIRFASDDVRTLEGLTLKGFIESETYEAYYEDSDETSIMFVRPPAPAQPQAEPARVNQGAGAVKNRALTSCIEDEQLNVTALYYMLANGFAGDIRRLKNELAKRPEKEQLLLLAAKNANKFPGLYLAFQNGHADAIEAFGNVLKELQVPLAKCVELLAAKNARKIPGLFLAFQYGHEAAIEAFGNVLKELQVPLVKCVELLAAKIGANGVPGLYWALRNGHAAAIEAFGKVLVELQVPPDKCVELLMVKGSGGVSGLSMALQGGHREAVEQYMKIVKKITPELGDEQRAALLQTIMKSHSTQIIGNSRK